MKHEEMACEIVNNFKGATVDHFGCCLMQEQIVKALASAEKKGREEERKEWESGNRTMKMVWNEAIGAALKALDDVVVCEEYSDCILEAESLINKLKRG